MYCGHGRVEEVPSRHHDIDVIGQTRCRKGTTHGARSSRRRLRLSPEAEKTGHRPPGPVAVIWRTDGDCIPPFLGTVPPVARVGGLAERMLFGGIFPEPSSPLRSLLPVAVLALTHRVTASTSCFPMVTRRPKVKGCLAQINREPRCRPLPPIAAGDKTCGPLSEPRARHKPNIPANAHNISPVGRDRRRLSLREACPRAKDVRRGPPGSS